MTEQKSTPNYLERYQEKVLRCYSKRFPTLFSISFDPVGTHRKSRAAFGFLLGLILALFLYLFIIRDLQLSNYVSFICGVTLVLLLSLGCSLSSQFRCMCLLSIPGFFGKAGRSVLKTLIIGYVIGGPILNLTLNAKEVMRSFGCTAQLTYNLTKTKYDLMFEPFKKAMQNMNESGAQIKKTLSSVDDLLKPIVKEVEGEDDLEDFKQDNETAVPEVKWENLTALVDELNRKNLTNLTSVIDQQKDTNFPDEDHGQTEPNITDKPEEQSKPNITDEPEEQTKPKDTDEPEEQTKPKDTDEPEEETKPNVSDDPEEQNETDEPEGQVETDEDEDEDHTETTTTDELEEEDEAKLRDELEEEKKVKSRGLHSRSRRSDEEADKEESEKAEANVKGEYYEAKYREKITARCKHELERGAHKCRENFAGAYKRCSDTVTWIAAWMLCWPMKLTFVCNLVQALGGNKICNPEGKIDVGIGEGYYRLKGTALL